MATSVTQFGVTYTFSADRTVGQFADGSYWVLGPVTINSITPDYASGQNGWEVNPIVQSPHGFTNVVAGFTESLIPALPYTASTNQSIVKTISGTFRQSYVKTAVVLTVLTEIPPDDGASVFRPPYAGTAKPLIPVSDFNWSLLPSFAPVGSPPSLESIVAKFSECLRMDHHAPFPRSFRPWDTLWDYQPNNVNEVVEAMLRLCFNDASIEDKTPAMIQLTQACIDRAFIVALGYTNGSTGHNPGHRIMAGWAAAMLDLTDIKTYLASAAAPSYQEETYLAQGNERVLWGGPSSETQYWNYLRGLGGNQSNRDPYGWVDGGRPVTTGSGGPGSAYQKIVSQPMKASALVSILIPATEVAWRPGFFSMLREYSDRWVTHGVWTEPDPAAPYTAEGTYQVDYGPNPASPGNPILGSGRFPGLHGLNADGGQYKSAFVAAVWNAYRNAEPPPPPPTPPAARGRKRRGAKLFSFFR